MKIGGLPVWLVHLISDAGMRTRDIDMCKIGETNNGFTRHVVSFQDGSLIKVEIVNESQRVPLKSREFAKELQKKIEEASCICNGYPITQHPQCPVHSKSKEPKMFYVEPDQRLVHDFSYADLELKVAADIVKQGEQKGESVLQTLVRLEEEKTDLPYGHSKKLD